LGGNSFRAGIEESEKKVETTLQLTENYLDLAEELKSLKRGHLETRKN